MTTIHLNGNNHRLDKPMNVTDLLRNLELLPVGLAVAVNDTVIPHDDYGIHVVHDGDRVEIIRAVGGG